jgi:hypothetical protein
MGGTRHELNKLFKTKLILAVVMHFPVCVLFKEPLLLDYPFSCPCRIRILAMGTGFRSRAIHE